MNDQGLERRADSSGGSRRARWFTGGLAGLSKLSHSRLFAFSTLLLLQLKVVWGMWLVRDLTSGDTANYFAEALRWHHLGRIDFAWSPLYTAFLGTFLNITPDAYVVCILHRLAIIFITTTLVLVLMRQWFPPGLAWLAAAWWAVLPIQYDALYEVHLFAVIPVLLAWIAAGALPGAWGRGSALAILITATFLVRNELIISCAIFGTVCLAREILGGRLALSKQDSSAWRTTLLSYVVPGLIAGSIVLFWYDRARYQGAKLARVMDFKHTLNVAQIYAFGYQQRHPDYVDDPWVGYAALMNRDFGKALPSLGEAVRLNPRAMLDHFIWNAKLIPNGLQVLLFNSMSGTQNPDYAPVHERSAWAVVLSIGTLAILTAGAVLLIRRREFWWRAWLKQRVWCGVAMLSTVPGAMVVMIMQRPRPSYLFSFGLLIMAVVGMSAFVLLRHGFPTRGAKWVWVPLIITLIVFIPSHYGSSPARGRPLRDGYETLRPLTDGHFRKRALLMAPQFGQVLPPYLNIPPATTRPGLDFSAIKDRVTDEHTLVQALEDKQIALFYANPEVMRHAGVLAFVENARSHGWEVIHYSKIKGEMCMVARKTRPRRKDSGILTEGAIGRT